MNKHASVTPDQEAVIRQFIAGCEVTNMPVPGYADLLLKMGYKLIAPDLRVSTNTIVRVPFGEKVANFYKDEYYADWEAFTNTEIDANASTSESTESDTLGNVLREEV